MGILPTWPATAMEAAAMLTDSELRQAAAALALVDSAATKRNYLTSSTGAAAVRQRLERFTTGWLADCLLTGFPDFWANRSNAANEPPKTSSGATGSAAIFNAILSYAAELGGPQRTILDDFNEYGLDAMLDYHSGRLGPPYDTAPEPTPKPLRKTSGFEKVGAPCQ